MIYRWSPNKFADAMPTPRIDTVLRFADALELDITDFLVEDRDA